MGYVSSTCTSLTPITNTNGQWSANDVSFQFHDPHGSSFTMTHGSGSSGYQGLRTNAKYKFFRMSYEWRGTNGGYLGSFWGNQSSTYIGGGGGYASGYKTVHYPNSSTTFSVRLRDTESNNDRHNGGITASFNQNDGNWHHTVCEVRPFCQRTTIDGIEMLSSLYQTTEPLVSGTGAFNQEGYCGVLWYNGQYEIKNFKVEPLELNTEWEHIATYTSTSDVGSITMDGILDQGLTNYHTLKLEIEMIRGTGQNADLRIDFLDSNNSLVGNNAYYGTIHEITHAGTHKIVGTSSAAQYGNLWSGNWEATAGGQSGTITIHNYDDTRILGNDILKSGNSTSYRAIAYSTLVGYDQDEAYARQDAFVRCNVDVSASTFHSVRLYYGSGNIEDDHVIHVYGQRGPRY